MQEEKQDGDRECWQCKTDAVDQKLTHAQTFFRGFGLRNSRSLASNLLDQVKDLSTAKAKVYSMRSLNNLVGLDYSNCRCHSDLNVYYSFFIFLMNQSIQIQRKTRETTNCKKVYKFYGTVINRVNE